MKYSRRCPKCGHTFVLEYKVWLITLLYLLGLIPGIVYTVKIINRAKCPKCGVMSIDNITVQTVDKKDKKEE